MKIVFYITLLLSLLFIACDKDLTQYYLIEKLKTSWTLQQLVDRSTNISDTLPTDSRTDLTFKDDNIIALITPCNSGTGKFDIKRDHIVVSDLAMTNHECERMALENKITDNLTGTFMIKENNLYIESDHNTELIFTKTEALKY